MVWVRECRADDGMGEGVQGQVDGMGEGVQS